MVSLLRNKFIMSHVSLIISLALFLSMYSILGEKHFHNDQGIDTYIVSINNNLKPSVFTNIEEWYNSILSKSNSNPNNSLLHVYKTVFHGFSARLRPEQANHLSAQVEVNDIFQDVFYQLQTTRSPQFLGLDTYQKPIGILKDSDEGSNVVVGVLDSGIWPESPSFSDEGLGPVPSHFKGECDGGPNFPPCNKKIVGARFFNSGSSLNVSLSARDKYGHGTHTSSTIAGRDRGSNVSFYGYAIGEATGIAPKARLSIYKVCWPGCRSSDVLAGFDKAVEDGVDVISVSLGGGPSRYNMDAIAIGAFGALQKGVFVSASAGNSGPENETLSNTAPWITTVGASTIDRKFPADVILDNGEILTGSSLYTGDPLLRNKTFPLVYFPSNASATYCEPDSLDKSLVKGKFVVCIDGGSISRSSKEVVVKKASGEGVIIAMYNTLINYNDTLKSEPFMYPGVTIPYPATMKLLSYIGKKEVKNATIVFHGTQIGKEPAPVVAAFSSRGPVREFPYLLKPDVIAPGVDILAAWPDNLSPSSSSEDPRRSQFNILSGTSMSCPHVSGIAALLKSAHKDWSPGRIRSALMTTAYRGYHELKNTQNQGPQSLWETGAGHVDPENANNVELVYDLSEDDYIDNLCANGYSEREIYTIVRRPVSCEKRNVNQWDLNYPAIIVTSNLLGKPINRTLTNLNNSTASSYTANVINPQGTNVTVKPLKLTFETYNETQRFTVNVQSIKLQDQMKDQAIGSITWTDGNHNVTIPLMLSSKQN